MCKKNEPSAITVFIVLFAIVTIVAEIVVVSKIENFCAEKLVLSFIGIIATFVVVSNLAQVIEIRNETNRKLDEVRKKLDLIEGYFNDSILKDLANILSKEDPFFKITSKSIISIKHRRNNVYHVEVRMVKREGHQIITSEYDVKYYEVDLGSGKCRPITKEDFDKETN